MQTIILWVGGFIIFAIFVHRIVTNWELRKLIDEAGKGDPNSVARALVAIATNHLQSIVGIALITMIFLAISVNIITSAVGFPFITSIGTYILAYNIKDVFLSDKR